MSFTWNLVGSKLRALPGLWPEHEPDMPGYEKYTKGYRLAHSKANKIEASNIWFPIFLQIITFIAASKKNDCPSLELIVSLFGFF